MTPTIAKLYRTAKTRVAVGDIPAGTIVAVDWCYTEDFTNRQIFAIRTKLFGGIEEEDVPHTNLEEFLL